MLPVIVIFLASKFSDKMLRGYNSSFLNTDDPKSQINMGQRGATSMLGSVFQKINQFSMNFFPYKIQCVCSLVALSFSLLLLSYRLNVAVWIITLIAFISLYWNVSLRESQIKDESFPFYLIGKLILKEIRIMLASKSSLDPSWGSSVDIR